MVEHKAVLPHVRQYQAVSRDRGLLRRIEPYLYLLPIFAVFGAFFYYPFLRTIHMSLSVVNAMGETVRFAGLDNFSAVIKDVSNFWFSLGVTARFALMVVPFQIGFGLLLALLAENRAKKSSFLRTLYALPMAVSSACASVIWLVLFNPATGLINWLVGLQYNWPGDARLALIVIAATTVWLSMGMNFLYAFSGLQGIPQELYESSAIEGASYWQTLRYVTLPSLSPTLFFLLVTNTIGAFQTFTQVNLITQGGPGKATRVLAYNIYRDAILNNRWGYASAESLLFMVVLLVVSALQFRMERKGVHYQ